jgi:ABC-type antimicrobial peptide transport system permease subunit
MQLLSLYTFNTEGILTMFLVSKHLYFLPTIADIGQNLLIILAITFLTAFFPAARAAKLSVAEALRHVE